jgi:hypothetical protein
MTLSPRESSQDGVVRADRWRRGDPSLMAGRGSAEHAVFVPLIIVGSVTDTTVFKTALDLVLRLSPVISWLLAAGITVIALSLAWTIGRLVSWRRCGVPGGSAAALAICATAWLLLGAALFDVRWQSGAGSAAPAFGRAVSVDTTALRSAHASAILFGAVYLASGLVTVMEAARFTNPLYSAYRRSEKALARGRRAAVACRARAERARLAVAHQAGEFDRDVERRNHALAERRALGAEMANYARVLMAQLMQDPRRTDITLSGPVPTAEPDDGAGTPTDAAERGTAA